jgi:hypothetical protein
VLPLDLRQVAQRHGLKARLPVIGRQLGVTERRQLSQIVGQHGSIRAHSPHELIAIVNKPKTLAKLLAIRDVRPFPGDEPAVVFPVDRIVAVAEALGIRRLHIPGR